MTVTLQHPRYQFDRYLAAGGMGEVWQATDTLLDREVAVKVLRRELAEDPVLRARFAAEARHAGALQHPHVASVLDYGEIVGQGTTPLPFLVMELVDGQPLSALLADGPPMAPQVAADLIAQAADGIEAAHALGIVHRDVKPGNLLVTPYGQVKVTDFGVARAADTASFTTTGHLIGTPQYLSPEQAEGGSATTVSDVYSLGIVLYECLTGRKPFAAETPVATALMQIRDPLPAFPDSVPERLQRITRVATAKEPSHRFRSAGAMAAALRDDSPDTRSYLLPQPGAQAAGPVVAAEQRHRALLGVRRVLVGLVALLLVTGGVWAMTGSSDEPVGAPAAEASSEDGADLVRVREKAFVGLPVAKATGKLERLGLRPRTERQPNPGDENVGTVAGVSPTGLLEPGTRVELSVWARPPAVTTSDADPSVSSGGGGGSGGDGAAPSGGGGGGGGGAGAPSGQGGAGSSSSGSSSGNGNAPGHSNSGGNPAGNGGGNGSSNAGSGNNNAGGNGNGNAGGNSTGGGKAKPGKGGKR